MDKICSVILVNYNGKDVNSSCIDSILFSKTELKLQVILVDNDSQDNSIELIKKQYGNQIHIIQAGYNSGFAHANNLGIQYAIEIKTDYIMLLNNDTVIEDSMIQQLFECTKKNDDCILVPRIMYFDEPERIWFGGGYIDKRTFNAKHIDEGKIYVKKYESEKKIEFATGCCIFGKKTDFIKVGNLDEDYFLYYEDADYSEKIKLAGLSILYVPKAVLYHKVSYSSGGTLSKTVIYYTTRNRLIYVNRFFENYKIWFYIYFFLSRFLYCLKWIITGKTSLAKVCILAISDYYHNRIGVKDLSKY